MFDLLLVEVEDYHILGFVLLTGLELQAVGAHELGLDILKLLIQHNVLQCTHYLIEESVIWRTAVICNGKWCYFMQRFRSRPLVVPRP